MKAWKGTLMRGAGQQSQDLVVSLDLDKVKLWLEDWASRPLEWREMWTPDAEMPWRVTSADYSYWIHPIEFV